MLKKFVLLCMILAGVSCARSAISEIAPSTADRSARVSQAYSVLWANHSSDAGNSNVVDGRLPVSNNPSYDQKSLGGQVHASPVIFKAVGGPQYVLALVHEPEGDKMTVKCFTDGGEECSGFNSRQFTSVNNGHQMSVNIENDVPMVYVAHANGVSKFLAFGEGESGSFDTNVPAFRLLIHQNDVFVQTTNGLLKLSTDLDVMAEYSQASDADNFNVQLPLVISGDYIFGVAYGNTIFKLKTIDLVNKDESDKDVSNIPSDYYLNDVNNVTIGMMAAYSVDSVIYSIRYSQTLESQTIESQTIVYGQIFCNFDYAKSSHCWSENNNIFNDPQANKFRKKDGTKIGFFGDHQLMGLPVDSVRGVLFPGAVNSLLTEDFKLVSQYFMSTNATGIRWFTPRPNADPEFGNPVINSDRYQNRGTATRTGNNYYFYNYLVPKFMIVDGERYFFYLREHVNHDDFSSILSFLHSGFDFTLPVRTVTSKVVLTGVNQSVIEDQEILAVSVGDGLVVMVDDEANIYFIK